MKPLVELENTCRSVVEDYCLSPGTPFLFDETSIHNRLEKTSISLKDLDYRVTFL
jgi:hypothetical protein